MKSLVICTDLYENSDSNVLAGYSLAKALGLKPLLYHVDTITPMTGTVFHPISIDTEYKVDSCWNKKIEKTVLQGIESQLERLKLKKEQFDFESFEGTINDGIDHLKSYSNVDFLAIGASHYGSVPRLFLNSFSEKSFFHLNKDVFAVKKEMKTINHITYLMPYSPINKNDLKRVSKLSKAFGSKVLVGCIVPIESTGMNLDAFVDDITPRSVLAERLPEYHSNAERLLKEVCEILKSEGVESSYSLKMMLNKSPVKSLEKMVTDAKSDLIILKPQHHTFEHLSVGSTTLELLKHVNSNFYLLSKS